MKKNSVSPYKIGKHWIKKKLKKLIKWKKKEWKKKNHIIRKKKMKKKKI